MVSKLKSYLADFTAIERCEIKIKGFEIEILFLNTNVCVCVRKYFIGFTCKRVQL